MSAPTAHPGGMLGRYRVLEQIGSGGMGVVYRARDERLQRDVAIKLLLPGSIRSTVARHQVRNEALALSRLNHPNIETIFEFDSQDDCDFLVVELIPGSSLDELLQHGPLAEEQAISLAEQLLRGLAAAHEKGIIHRDLKPSNIRLTSEGFLKILDFGLAHLHDTEVEKHERTTETHSTLLSGTLAYMSPEQLHHAAPDARSDIYAAGLVLYEMCTGRRPFTESGALLIDAILNRPAPTPSKFNSAVGPKLDAVILRALEKDPARRYQSAKEILEALEQIDGHAGSGIERSLFAIAACVLVIVALAVGWLERGHVQTAIEHRLHPVPANKYVAVMPFRSIGADDPAFNQGLTEAVAAKLMEMTAAQSVQVVSPRELVAEHVTSVEEARKKLGVNLAIEGTLQRLGSNMRVTLELVEPSSKKILRAAEVNAPGEIGFALQDSVLDRVLQMMELVIHEGNQKQDTTNPYAYVAYTRGVGLLTLRAQPDDVDTAIRELSSAVVLDPGYAKAHAALGMALLMKYNGVKDASLIASASKECNMAAALAEASSEANLCLGKLRLTTGAYEEASSTFRSIIDAEPSNYEAYGSLALAEERTGRIADAERALQQAIAARPEYAGSYDRLAQFYSRQARYADAAKQFQNAIDRAPEVPRYWASLGAIYYLSGSYQEALSALQHAVQMRPSIEAYSNLGNSYFVLGHYDQAIEAFQQEVALAPNQAQAHGNLARAYYWNKGTRGQGLREYGVAMELLDRELKINPRDPDLHLLAALYSAMLQRREDAVTHLQLSLSSGSNQPETLYFAAIVHAVLGERQKSIEFLRRSLRDGYSRSEASRTPELADAFSSLDR